MATITIKNIPDDLYERLKQSAETHRRSINSEVIVYLERSLLSQRVSPEATLARARQLREKIGEYRLADDELTTLKAAGRP